MSRNPWPAEKVERRPVESLIPYKNNARTHSESQVAQIAASIKEYGFTVPVLIDPNGNVIAGHGRIMAAKALGLADIPVMVAKGWSAAKRRAYVILDNQLALNAGWDQDLLKLELTDLQAEGFDIGALGFDVPQLAAIMDTRTEGLTDPDEVPEPPAVPVSQLGDVWTLGRHRLVCGDCTAADTVLVCLNGAKPHLMVTDPPYGVGYDPSAARAPTVGSARGKVANDDRADWRGAWELFPGDVAYVWHSMLHAATVAESLVATGFTIRAEIVWAKNQLVMSRGHYHPQHESCWYAVRNRGHWSGDRTQSTLWEIDKPRRSETGHGTQKPIECMKRPIENNSKPGDAVYEPFLGSGTTIIAAEMTGRACHAVELWPAYVDVAVTRWQNFTGQSATLDGKTFEQVKVERQNQAAA